VHTTDTGFDTKVWLNKKLAFFEIKKIKNDLRIDTCKFEKGNPITTRGNTEVKNYSPFTVVKNAQACVTKDVTNTLTLN